MCIYILGWRNVTYHFRVTVTLTAVLVLIIIVSGAYILYYLKQESQIRCVDASWDSEVSYTIFRIVMFGAFFSILFELGIPNLVCGCILWWQSVMYQFCDLDLISTITVSGAYLIYYLREEFQICCIDTSLDADI